MRLKNARVNDKIPRLILFAGLCKKQVGKVRWYLAYHSACIVATLVTLFLVFLATILLIGGSQETKLNVQYNNCKLVFFPLSINLTVFFFLTGC